jgi:L-2-aminoadipate reductase
VIPPASVITYEVLAEWMHEHKLTVTHLTPAMGQILVGGATTSFPWLRNAFFVGDLLTKKDTRKLRALAPNAAVTNFWGTTETQRAVSFFRIPSETEDAAFLDSLPDVIPIGQGIVDVQLLVIDREDPMRLCGVGEQGELYLRAAGLAEGYLGHDEQTLTLNQSKFIPNWFVGKAIVDSENPLDRGPRDRIYRSGDLGRYRADGSVECTGRIDSQVKIRGFRIELGEIDIALSQHSFVRENLTLVRRDRNEEATLVTYFVPETYRWFQHLDQQQVGEEELLEETLLGMLRRFKSLSDHCKQFLADKLPSYAVPTIFVPLARMPLSRWIPPYFNRLTR